MNGGTPTTLLPHETGTLEYLVKRGLGRGTAVLAIARVLGVLQDLQGSECPRCKEEHQALANDFNIAGLHTALEALGQETAADADHLAEVLNVAADRAREARH